MTKQRPRRPILPGLEEADPTEIFVFKVIAQSIITLPDNITTVLLNTDLIVVGDPAQRHVRISPLAVQLKDGDTVYTELTNGQITVGPTNSEHILITPTALQWKDDVGVYAELTSRKITLGSTSDHHIDIESDYVHLNSNSDTYTSLAAGVITVGLTSQDHIRITSSAIQLRDASTIRGEWQTDGDIFIGSDISAPASTYFAILAQAQTYNSESFEAGDMLIGDNSSSKANIFWDKSAGRLNFRGGTTVGAYIDTDGTLVAGTGTVALDSNGISIQNKDSLTQDENNALTFKNASDTTTAGIYGMDAGGGSPQNEMDLAVHSEAAHNAQLSLTADSPSSSYTATIAVTADDGSQTEGITVQAGGSTPGTSIEGTWLNLNTTVLILPRRTTTQRDALTPVNGMILYNSTTGTVEAYESGAWVNL